MRAPNIPRTLPDPRLAQREHLLKRDHELIEIEGDTYPLIGFSRMLDCETSYAKIKYKLVITGLIEDVKPIAPDAAVLLCAEQGHGAVCALIRRTITSIGEGDRDEQLPLTVFAPIGTDGDRLVDCCKRRIPVKAIVKIEQRPPAKRTAASRVSNSPVRSGRGVRRRIARRGLITGTMIHD